MQKLKAGKLPLDAGFCQATGDSGPREGGGACLSETHSQKLRPDPCAHSPRPFSKSWCGLTAACLSKEKQVLALLREVGEKKSGYCRC